jgi:hypothetical protein
LAVGGPVLGPTTSSFPNCLLSVAGYWLLAAGSPFTVILYSLYNITGSRSFLRTRVGPYKGGALPAMCAVLDCPPSVLSRTAVTNKVPAQFGESQLFHGKVILDFDHNVVLGTGVCELKVPTCERESSGWHDAVLFLGRYLELTCDENRYFCSEQAGAYASSTS